MLPIWLPDTEPSQADTLSADNSITVPAGQSAFLHASSAVLSVAHEHNVMHNNVNPIRGPISALLLRSLSDAITLHPLAKMATRPRAVSKRFTG
jgi:hypothetical protein